MALEPITARPGRPALGAGPFEGVPPHLRQPLSHWLRERVTYPSGIWDHESMHRLVATGRVAAPTGLTPDELYRWMSTRSETLLDVIHVALQLWPTPMDAATLDMYLEDGGSVWRATDRGLERRIDTEAQAAFDSAIAPKDPASEELGEAWTNAYGRQPNPSDAWDHAIKAVEAVLISVVVPNMDRPTLGNVLGQLSNQSQLWKIGVPGPNNDYNIEPLVGMLRLIWPNPDRHGSPAKRRTPTLAEARAVVHLAVTIVQWGRDNQIVRK